MLWKTCCASCRTHTANKNSSVRRTKQDISMALSNCAICGKKNQGSL